MMAVTKNGPSITTAWTIFLEKAVHSHDTFSGTGYSRSATKHLDDDHIDKNMVPDSNNENVIDSNQDHQKHDLLGQNVQPQHVPSTIEEQDCAKIHDRLKTDKKMWVAEYVETKDDFSSYSSNYDDIILSTTPLP